MKHDFAGAVWIALWGGVDAAVVYSTASAGHWSLAAGLGLLGIATLTFFGRMALQEVRAQRP